MNSRNFIIIIFALFFYFSSQAQSDQRDEIKGLIIDPTIKNKVEKRILKSKELDSYNKMMQVYFNSAAIECYISDTLAFAVDDTSKRTVFKSFYLWQNDTLTIDGAFGLFGGVGFAIRIHKNKAEVFHMLSSDDFPTFAYNENDSLIWRLEVPCINTKIILSEVPDSTKNQIIYGYVEFHSGNFYSSEGSTENGEILPRLKQRTNMKVYFKSSKLNY